jgi:hypothetical protein
MAYCQTCKTLLQAIERFRARGNEHGADVMQTLLDAHRRETCRAWRKEETVVVGETVVVWPGGVMWRVRNG